MAISNLPNMQLLSPPSSPGLRAGSQASVFLASSPCPGATGSPATVFSAEIPKGVGAVGQEPDACFSHFFILIVISHVCFIYNNYA